VRRKKGLTPSQAVSELAAKLDKELKQEEYLKLPGGRGRFEVYYNNGKTKALLYTQDAELVSATGGVIDVHLKLELT